ncbi:MAG: hypothetical protein MJ057_04775 [Sphaerochaetaceae bacterium]|nr:hypothetical protein [Sphaerochaetaceae bacterium]
MVSDEKLFKIAMAYYKSGHTQMEIAQDHGVSHVQIGKYLKLAQERGIVEIRVNAPFVPDDEEKRISLYLKEMFNLQKLVLVPTAANEKLTAKFLSDGVSEYLLKTFPNQSLNIGFGSGKTMDGISQYKVKTVEKRTQWSVYPVTNYPFDSLSTQYNYFNYDNLVQNFAQNWGAKQDRTFMGILKDKRPCDVSTIWKDLDVIVGGIGIPFSRSPEARESMFGHETAEKYALADIQGDFINYFYDDNGNIIEPLAQSPYRIDVQTMKSIPVRIAVASSFQKVFSIIGLLKCGLVNTLVTDLATAKTIEGVIR